jgi:hypothetical protein
MLSKVIKSGRILGIKSGRILGIKSGRILGIKCGRYFSLCYWDLWRVRSQAKDTENCEDRLIFSLFIYK